MSDETTPPIAASEPVVVQPEQPTKNRRLATAVVSMLIGICILILAGLYIWGAKIEKERQDALAQPAKSTTAQ
jgi:Tfp pilus assembly protein PilN